eukprot:GHRR01036404.1.p1 GENE.GHRR01036404.1~~GHRR01036404.1.p1  ORF type:complete len:139 (-),score=36.17 GHRR01036404.1:487-903(-)
MSTRNLSHAAGSLVRNPILPYGMGLHWQLLSSYPLKWPGGLCCDAGMLCLLLLQIMFYRAHVPLVEVVKGFVTPFVPRSSVSQAVALVGSLIMPHNIYLHSALVQSRTLRRQDDSHKQEALLYYSIESGLSLLVSKTA